ncbi:UDP-glucose 4-epimerase GalE [Cellulomonas humilata]|uniref:UDP-glucose 4-epimerase n=1 Tax=Cellulomonas humilata TaxID=144055 RepID=A0A7Y6DYC5_9CELL|nr:UDP-glucose 4-epimerase GalE [Cellulomonas humilata]NUU17859.1 UDP-glucose 4-epimerase GalE [Cellulomonas humilata]
MTVLVTGGAGYIGGHVLRVLGAAGRDVLVVDDLSTGRAARLDGVPLLRLDLADPGCVPHLAGAMRTHGVTSVVHLAARKRVHESVLRPLWYLEQNVGGVAHVIAAMERAGVASIVFSSSAAVYGCPANDLVHEDDALAPVNPYGRTKLAGEWLVRSAARAWGLRAVSLRYFNVAGAGAPELGDDVVANLVTCALDRLARGQRPEVFGTGYPTPDGSCVRDFVHVSDLAEAHVVALDRLDRGGPLSDAVNIGLGTGASVLEVLERLGAVSGLDTTPTVLGPRAGDPARVVAAVDRARDELGWVARSDLSDILLSAWQSWQAGPRAIR